MKNFLKSSSAFIGLIFILTLQFTPALALADEPKKLCGEGTLSCFIVKCNYNNDGSVVDSSKKVISNGEYECGFPDVIREINLLTTTAFKLSVPFTIFAIAWAGIKILLAQGNPGKITEAKTMMGKVLIGFIFILTGWLIVYTISNSLLLQSGPGAPPSYLGH